MLLWDQWIAFFMTVSLLAFTPGPSVLLVASQSIRFGAGPAGWTILGDLTANLFQMALASLGLGILLQCWSFLFFFMKWLGVAYFLVLGVTHLVSSNGIQLPVPSQTLCAEPRRRGLFVEGFTVSALNPKAILFFAALFPLFVDSGAPVLPQFVLLAGSFLVLDGVALMLYSRLAGHLGRCLETAQPQRSISRIIGLLLLFAAGSLGWQAQR